MAHARSTQHHIDLCDMAEIYVRDEFKYNVLLSPMVLGFPLENLLINTWFNLPKEIDDEQNYDYAVCHVNIMNLVTKEPLSLTPPALASTTLCLKKTTMLSYFTAQIMKALAIFYLEE